MEDKNSLKAYKKQKEMEFKELPTKFINGDALWKLNMKRKEEKTM